MMKKADLFDDGCPDDHRPGLCRDCNGRNHHSPDPAGRPVTITLTCDSALEVVFDEDVPTGVVRATIQRRACRRGHQHRALRAVCAAGPWPTLARKNLTSCAPSPESSTKIPPSPPKPHRRGNLYLFVSSNDESDIDSLFTIYEGYFVELIQYHDDYSEQTDADDDFARFPAVRD